MKKLTLLVVLLTTVTLTSFSQTPIVKKGSITFSPGIGIASSWTDYGDQMKVPPVSASIDFGVAPDITIGPYVAYSSTANTYDNYSYTHELIGAKGTYHFEIADKITGHVGAILGYHIVTASTASASAAGSVAFYDFLLGATYHFSKGSGVFAELGYGITYLNIGLSLSLK